jgi:hypothetical protein
MLDADAREFSIAVEKQWNSLDIVSGCRLQALPNKECIKHPQLHGDIMQAIEAEDVGQAKHLKEQSEPERQGGDHLLISTYRAILPGRILQGPKPVDGLPPAPW